MAVTLTITTNLTMGVVITSTPCALILQHRPTNYIRWYRPTAICLAGSTYRVQQTHITRRICAPPRSRRHLRQRSTHRYRQTNHRRPHGAIALRAPIITCLLPIHCYATQPGLAIIEPEYATMLHLLATPANTCSKTMPPKRKRSIVPPLSDPVHQI